MAAEEEIRIGRVSACDYDNGMIEVVYTDRDSAVTKPLPYLNFNGEYKMPSVGSYVLVAHLSNGAEAGVVLGGFWNKANHSAASGKGVYRKELGSSQGEAFIQYSNGTLQISADAIQFTGSAGSITLAQIISKLNQI